MMRNIITLFCILFFAQQTWAKESRSDFTVHPNRLGRETLALDTPPNQYSTCIFEWDSMGATPEQWEIVINGDLNSGKIECYAQRFGGTSTYLLFSGYKLTIGLPDNGPQLSDFAVYDNEGTMLPSDQVVVKTNGVHNSPGWSGQVNHVRVSSALMQ